MGQESGRDGDVAAPPMSAPSPTLSGAAGEGWAGGARPLYQPRENLPHHRHRLIDVGHPGRAVRRPGRHGARGREPGALEPAHALARHPAGRGAAVAGPADDVATIVTEV